MKASDNVRRKRISCIPRLHSPTFGRNERARQTIEWGRTGANASATLRRKKKKTTTTTMTTKNTHNNTILSVSFSLDRNFIETPRILNRAEPNQTKQWRQLRHNLCIYVSAALYLIISPFQLYIMRAQDNDKLLYVSL